MTTRKAPVVEKVFNSLKVNQGFPEGTSFKDLKTGRWILVRWSDVPGDEWAIIVEHDDRPHNFKGDRTIHALAYYDGSWRFSRHISQTQIVKFGPMLSARDPDDLGNRMLPNK